MDVIDEVLGGLRSGQALAREIRQSGRWGLLFPAFPGVGFHVILQGSGWLIRAHGEPTRVRAGDLVFAPHGAAHGFSHDPQPLDSLSTTLGDAPAPASGPSAIEFLCGAYRLDAGRVHLFLRRLPDVIRVSPDYDRYPDLRALADLLCADIARARPGAGVSRPALVDLLLVNVLRIWHEEQGAPASGVADAAIATALHEIHIGPQTPWTVQRLSELAGMSRTAFTRRFTAAVGQPPMTYVIGRRLTAGAQLLRDTEAPLNAIARQVGYSSEFAFAAAFRREFGIAPGRFRRRSRESQPDPQPAPA